MAPQRNPVRGEAYSAARGAGLIGLAVFVGFILFQIVDSPGGGGDGGGGDGGSTVVDDTTPTQPTLAPNGGGEGTARDPSEFTTIVLNAGQPGGSATNISNTLRSNGYNVLTPSNATAQEGTTVQCMEGYDAEGQALLFVLAGNATIEPYEPPPADAGADAAGATCVVYLGTTATTES